MWLQINLSIFCLVIVNGLTLDSIIYSQKDPHVHAKSSKLLQVKQDVLDKKMESLAVVPYDSSILSPFHFDKRQFYFAGQDVIIKQKWGDLGVAAVVWDAAIVLCEYFETHPELIHGKQIIELGAGMGLAGLVAALIGVEHVVITDRAMVLEDLRRNIDDNIHDLTKRSTVEIKELDWSKNLDHFSKEYDLVIGADIVYIEETFPDLLRTISHLCRTDTQVILASKIRYKKDSDFYKTLERKFDVVQIFYERDKDIIIYSAKLKPLHKEL